MTAAETKQLFLILYDKVTNLAAPGYTNAEITSFLNKAQLQFIKQRYNEKGNKYQEGYEETEKRRKDLSELTSNINLVSSDLSSNQVGVSPNGSLYNLPKDFLYTLREEITVSSTDACDNGKRIKVKPVSHDEYTININNPWKKPSIELAWRLDFKSDNSANSTGVLRHEIITDGSYTIDTYHVRYLKIPVEIDIDNDVPSELHESVHDEIVDIAVRIATGITDPASYNVKRQEESQTE